MTHKNTGFATGACCSFVTESSVLRATRRNPGTATVPNQVIFPSFLRSTCYKIRRECRATASGVDLMGTVQAL